VADWATYCGKSLDKGHQSPLDRVQAQRPKPLRSKTVVCLILDPGQAISKVRRSGERVIIDGPCLSACTLVLSTIPRNRICVTSRAVPGFHAPQIVDEKGRSYCSREATRAVTAAYPPAVRAWIKRNGGLSKKMIVMRGRRLRWFKKGARNPASALAKFSTYVECPFFGAATSFAGSWATSAILISLPFTSPVL
jgi:hypothetical protein